MQHIKSSLFRLRAYALRRDRLPPSPDVGALIVLFVYEGFRRCAAPPPRYGYVARFTGFECRSPAARQIPIFRAAISNYGTGNGDRRDRTSCSAFSELSFLSFRIMKKPEQASGGAAPGKMVTVAMESAYSAEGVSTGFSAGVSSGLSEPSGRSLAALTMSSRPMKGWPCSTSAARLASSSICISTKA